MQRMCNNDNNKKQYFDGYLVFKFVNKLIANATKFQNRKLQNKYLADLIMINRMYAEVVIQIIILLLNYNAGQI